MRKLSALVAVLGLALLVASAVPWGATARGQGGPPPADAAYGRQLFSAKGCAQCHAHAGIPNSGVFGGMYGAPDLTNRPGDPAYQRAWLRDPQALKPTTQMPNLGLDEAEIAALVAFLQAGNPSPR
jgi:cytochrome c1